MCDGRRLHRRVLLGARPALTRAAIAVMVCAALVPPRLARAQTSDRRPVAERFAEALRRADSLKRRDDERKAAAENAAPPLRLVEGMVHLRYDTTLGPRTLSTLREAMRIATARIAAVQGDAAARTIGQVEFIAGESTFWGFRLLDLRPRGSTVGGAQRTRLPARARDLARYFEDFAAAVASSMLEPTPRGFQIHGAIPAGPLDADAWTDLAIWTATSSSSVARRCLDGSLSDCRRLLIVPADGTLDAWYEPADYPAIVERHDWTRDSVRLRELARRCVTGRDAAACSAAAHEMSPPYPVPLAPMQQSLRALALERGGTHALSRMLNAAPDDRVRLEAASGMGFEALLREWQRRVAAARPQHGVLGILVATLWFATLVFALARRRPSCV
ncbi:MAG: hypothetical protein HY084_06535 [Gemmatimonadetes bacterium]|nr:hypothetical protein [Gemmatimonadota bacterium]